jgi:hypothetical protein
MQTPHVVEIKRSGMAAPSQSPRTLKVVVGARTTAPSQPSAAKKG